MAYLTNKQYRRDYPQNDESTSYIMHDAYETLPSEHDVT